MFLNLSGRKRGKLREAVSINHKNNAHVYVCTRAHTHKTPFPCCFTLLKNVKCIKFTSKVNDIFFDLQQDKKTWQENDMRSMFK